MQAEIERVVLVQRRTAFFDQIGRDDDVAQRVLFQDHPPQFVHRDRAEQLAAAVGDEERRVPAADDELQHVAERRIGRDDLGLAVDHVAHEEGT